MELHGCRVAGTPLASRLGVCCVVECTVSGRSPRGPGEALGELRSLVAWLARETGAPLEPPGRLHREGLAGGGYWVYSAPVGLPGGVGEARLVTAEWLGAPLLALVALPRRVEGLEPGLRLGSPLEGPLAPAWEPPPAAAGGPRQKPVPRFIIYRAEPTAPEHPGVLEVELPGGRVERLALEEVLAEAEAERLDFHCVTGWSVEGRRWLVAALERLVPIPGGGCWAAAESAGGYTAVLPCSEARRALLALGVDGRPLPRENGGPLRLLAPSLYGWKSVKWLTRIRIVEGYSDGFWEALGYHERGLWSREERFKIRNPELPAERLEP